MTSSAEDSDPYTDPQTSVLRNKLGIDSPGILAEVEADLTAARTVWLTENPVPGTYDLPHLRAFHRLLSKTSTSGREN